MGWNQVAWLPSVGIAAFTWQFNETSLLADVCRDRYLCFYDFIAWWWFCAAYLDCCKEIQVHWPFFIDLKNVIIGQFAILVRRMFRWSFLSQTIHNNEMNKVISVMVCGSCVLSFRWLPSTTSSSDRSRPGSCVCVGMRRTGSGNQRSQRLALVCWEEILADMSCLVSVS